MDNFIFVGNDLHDIKAGETGEQARRGIIGCGGRTELSERTVDETEEEAINQPLGLSARLSE